MCDKHWFKDTSRLSVPVYFSWQLFLPPCIMAEDWQMDTEDASSQVFQAFRSLAPFLDGSLKLTPNPGALKRQKVRPDSKDLKDDKSNVDSGLTPALQVMARMLIHLDRDQQMQKREDTYIFFFNSAEETGSLHLLRKTAEQWHNQSTQGSSSLRTPLRQLLLQKLFQDLMDRIQKLLDAPEGSELMQKAMDAMILLPDRTFPYLEWNPVKKALQVSKKTPLSLEQNAPELHRDVGHAERPIDHTTIPCPPGEGEQQCSPLASPGQPTGGQTLGTTPSPCKFQRLDTDGYELEASQQDAISIGAATGTNDELNNWEGSQERQGQGQESQTLAADHQEGAQHTLTRTDMMSILSHAVMENPNNWCFANATVQSLLWCMLSLTHFDPNMWGLQCSTLMNFLHKLNTQAGNLSQESFFTEVLQCWGPADMAATQSSISQQDAAEFVQHWLQLLDTDTFDMRWEKRLTVADDVRVMDTNAKHTPICFKFNVQTMLMQTCDLTSLGVHWHQDDGMLTCLVTASDCLCIHLDRSVHGPTGISKCLSPLQSDTEVLLPIFIGDTDFDHVGYTIVALMAHQGSDGAGHYRTALKVSPHVRDRIGPVSWLLLDDWRNPEPVWNLPAWFTSTVTVIWMVRTDVLHLHAFRRTAVEESQRALWDMLATRPTPGDEAP